MKTAQIAISDARVAEPAPRIGAPHARMNAGAFVARRELLTISGEAVPVPHSERYIHLQFRRFAGCPICHLHLRSFVQRHDEIAAAGIAEVLIFHSTAETLRPFAADLPFAVVADPRKFLYLEFGVEASLRSLLDPRVWLPILRGVSRSLWEVIFRRQPVPSLQPEGGRLGLPADFLIASDGTVAASKYGVHSYDQWSVNELLQARRAAEGQVVHR